MSGAGLEKLIQEYRIYHCLECGKCTGACPLAQADRAFSPRLLAREAIEQGLSSACLREGAWACLTCGLCTERCPSGIDFAGFVAALRPLLLERELPGRISHGGALQTLMRLQALPTLRQNRLDWLDPNLKTAREGELLFFGGCAPYFQVFLSHLDLDLTGIANSVILLLNRLGITPAVLPEERCCGHDLYYGGERAAFESLKELNLASFKKTGVRTVVTACPECAHTLGDLYGPETGLEVQHLAAFLAGQDLNLERTGQSVTYQDPCRLARFAGITDAPRELLGRVAEVREMAHFGRSAWCCGNSAWIGCGRYAKRIQIQRLEEAWAGGAQTLVTACPKCLIHLTCAQRDLEDPGLSRIELKDITTVMAQALKEEP